MDKLNLQELDPLQLRREDIADASEGLQEILDAIEAGTIDVCPPLLAVLVRVLDAMERLLVQSSGLQES